MDAKTINQTYDLFSLVAQESGRLQKTGVNWWAGQCPFCGGVDRFVLHQTPDGWRWMCRKCGDDKYHGTIDYVMQRDHSDFPTALKALGGTVSSSKLKNQPSSPAGPKPKIMTFPDASWQESAWQDVDKAERTIMYCDEKLGKLGFEYLFEKRGIIYPSILCWHLGLTYAYDPNIRCNRLAISIPNFDLADNLISVKYRFIDGRDDWLRYTLRIGSVNYVFGLAGLCNSENLIICEGEFNAISIRQVKPVNCDVISPGSETIGAEIKKAIRNIADNYKQVFVWMDDRDKAKRLAALIGTKCMFKSPVVDGKKYDANELLKHDLLHSFLVEMKMTEECKGWLISDYISNGGKECHIV